MNDYRFGNKIYELRKKKNLTQEDLAILLDISDKAVYKWENGTSKPTIENLKKLSDIFDISLDDLIEDEDKKSKQKITKIVLTGGPGSGKTTVLNKIKQDILEIEAKIEVNIDYPEYDDLENMTKNNILPTLNLISKKFKKIISESKNSKICSASKRK